jgi:hypothetical protein
MNRKDDKSTRTYFRSDRIFFMNGKWYFSSREGEQGPFASREYAEKMLARFITEKVELLKFQRSRATPEKLTTLVGAERERNALKASIAKPFVAPEVLI